jgi:mono/diheme cytochrome c family protein
MLRAACTFALVSLAIAGHAAAGEPAAAAIAPEQVKFFEEQVRPVLASNCFKCHGTEKQNGHLRLDSLGAMLTGGESGPAIVPGKPDESLVIDAINHGSFEMPPETKLKDEEIASLTQWVKLGAPWPGETGATPIAKRARITDEDRAFWSFQPVTRPALPAITNDHWSRGPLDRFILARLQEADIEPANESAPEQLIRRLYFDLTGLPPSPAEIDAYLNDAAADKYERLVDRLLASPRYGERSARAWLDLVRYAESDGYKQDSYRPHAWRYRDYVIDAFNADKPYDQFVREQLAGDELAPHDPAAIAATGYLRAGIYEYNAKDARTQWNFILNDVTDVTADVFLGMGVSCARCHDHKFDPILQADYFRLRAFFAPLLSRDDVPLATPHQRAEYEGQLAGWLEETVGIRTELAALEEEKLAGAAKDEIKRFPADVQAMYLKPASERTPFEQQIAYLVARQAKEKQDGVNFEAALKNEKEKLARWKELREQLKQTEANKPADLPVTYTVTDVGPVAPPTTIPASRRKESPPIEPGFLTILDPPPATISPLANNSQTTGRRSALAAWITRSDNPLTARVMVNRVWQQHFGRGLVGTSSDFGKLGERPSHPELLDYLAAQFVDSGWHLKDLHRAIVTSATYRQTALRSMPEKARVIDPTNRLLWRMNTRRLEAEQIRDAMLAASGELSLAAGGEGVDAAQPRRSIYTKIYRNKKDALLEVFDVADGLLSTPQRNVTTTAPQALLMINSDITLKRADAFAASLVAAHPGDDQALVRLAYRSALGRAPTDSEANAALHFLHSGKRPQALVDFAHALLNANEFLYVD